MSIDFAAIRDKLAKTKSGLKKAGTTISPKPGKNRYVLLPPWSADAAWHHNFGVHYIKDEADATKAVYICADRTHGTDCQVCNAMAEAQRTAGVTDPKIAGIIKKAYAAQRFLVGVLALDSDQPTTPQVLQVGRQAFEQLVSVVEDWAEQVFDPSNPQIVVIERTGTTQNDTSYSVQPSPSRHKLSAALKPIDLGEFVKQESEAAEKKAIAAVRTLAIGSGTHAPRLGGAPAKPAAQDEFEDVPDLSAPAAKPGTAALDADIDDLLAELN